MLDFTKIETIKSFLCYYDKQHPDYQEYMKDFKKEKECYCDNCFNNSHELASEILRLNAIIRNK